MMQFMLQSSLWDWTVRPHACLALHSALSCFPHPFLLKETLSKLQKFLPLASLPGNLLEYKEKVAHALEREEGRKERIHKVSRVDGRHDIEECFSN